MRSHRLKHFLAVAGVFTLVVSIGAARVWGGNFSDGLTAELFSRCYAPESLSMRPGERRVRKGIRIFDRPPKLSADESTGAAVEATKPGIPARLRGSIRRVALDGERKAVALTLDLCEQRGEVAGYDGAIFDLLRGLGVKATIFVGGKWLRSHPERARQLIADPLFELGNHAEAHRNLRGLSGGRLRAEILGPQIAFRQQRAALAAKQCLAGHPRGLDTVPETMGLFRFPFGACNARSMRAVNDLGLLAVQWDVSTGDPSPAAHGRFIARQILRRVRPGSIVIAHANGRGVHTLVGLKLAVPKLLAQGYEFVTVSELLGMGTPVIADTCYNSRRGDTDRYDRFFKRAR